MEKMRNNRVRRLKKIFAELNFFQFDVDYEVLEGSPSEAIPAYIKNNGADIVLLGSMSRTGIVGFFMGNTAETLLNQIDGSVLTLKPDDFHSPVLNP